MSLVNAENRSDAVQEAAGRFEMGTLVHPEARQVAMAFARLAQELILRIRGDNAQERLLVSALENLHTARQIAINAVLPEARREQFQGNEAIRNPVPETAPAPAESKPTVRKSTARSRTAATAS